MFRLINFGLHAIEIVVLVMVLRRQKKAASVHWTFRGALGLDVNAIRRALLRVELSLLDLSKKGGKITMQIDDLKVAVAAVAAAEADEEQRIDTLIEALKMPHDSPEVAEVIAHLEETRARLSQFHKADAPA